MGLGLGLRLGLSNSRGATPPPTYSDAAQALFARMSVQPSSGRKTLYDNMISDLVDGGVWAKLDYLYIWAAEDQSQAEINLVQDAYNPTLSGTVDFVADRGFKGNGTNFMINTGFAPGVGTQYQKDSFFAGFAIQDTDGTGDKSRRVSHGAGNSGGGQGSLIISPDNAGTNGRTFRGNTTAAQLVTSASTDPSHWYVNRTSSTSYDRIRDAAVLSSGSSSGSTVFSLPIIHFAGYASLTPTYNVFATVRGSMAVAGAGLTTEERELFFYTVNHYLSEVGAETKKFRPEANAKIALSPLNPVQNDEVTYTLTIADGTYSGTMDIAVEGDLVDGDFDASFISSLQAAADSATGASFNGVSTLTFDETFSGTLSWARTLTGAVGDGDVHAVRLSGSSSVKLWRPYAAVLTGNPAPVNRDKLFGWNNSGFEFSTTLPPSDATFDLVYSKGFRGIRLPYRIHRVQPSLYGDIDGPDAASYKAKVLYHIALGDYVMIDPHDYGGRNIAGVTHKVGSDEFPADALAAHLVKMVAYIGNDPKLLVNLMNEPNGLPIARWWAAAQTCVDALRANGFYGEIQVPGGSHSTASQWVSSGNGAHALLMTDPLDNHAFDVHQYFDSGQSGTSGVCTVGSDTRLDAVTTWATANSKKLVLGEWAVGDPAVSGQEACGDVFTDVISTLSGNACWTGSLMWGLSDRWNSTYIFRALPPDYIHDPDTNIMDQAETGISAFL